MERKLPKPQLNINCPKCRKFVKSTASKQLPDQTRCIAECKGCKIKILNISKNKGSKYDSINEQIDAKTFKKYLADFSEKRFKNKELIMDFLAKKNKVATTRSIICKELQLKPAIVQKILKKLKDEKKIIYGYIAPYRYGFGRRKRYVMIK